MLRMFYDVDTQKHILLPIYSNACFIVLYFMMEHK